MTSSNIVPLTEENLPAAADSLAQAFHNDPLQTYVFPEESERRMRSPAHFAPLYKIRNAIRGSIDDTRQSIRGSSLAST